MNASTKQTIGVLFLCALIAFLLALIPMDCHAETLTPDAALTAWNAANNGCSDGNAACKRRDALTRALTKHGYTLHNHDIWTSAAQEGHFAGVVDTDEEFYSTPRGFVVTALTGPVSLQTWRKYLTDDVIIALWNDNAESIKRDSPHAYPVLKSQIETIIRQHAGSNDPRYALDY